MLLSERFQFIYPISVFKQRFFRKIGYISTGKKYAKHYDRQPLPLRVVKHQSLLLRKLGNTDTQLQHNKVRNLSLAIQHLDGLLIKPGETFSFWKLVGNPTAKRGYKEGLLLWNGEAIQGIGGGLCQLSNMLCWLSLHTPLIITERYRHTFDAFPDSGRTIPFGTGATIFYNYIDFQFFNPTDITYQLLLEVSGQFLIGEFRTSMESPVSFHIIERNHRYIKDSDNGKYYRSNEIYRSTVDKKTGNTINEELLFQNHCEMKYTPTQPLSK